MRILLVEDNPGDAELFLKCGQDLNASIRWVESAEAALSYLRHESPFEREPTPALVVTDLGLNRATGIQLITQMRADPQLKNIRIAVLTGTARGDEMKACERLGVTQYFRKPLNLADWKRTVRQVIMLAEKNASAAQSERARASVKGNEH